MAISTVYEPDLYNGDDSTDTFPITFAYLSTASYIKVSIRGTDDSLTEKTSGTHYNVTSDNVVFTAGNIPATGERVIIELDPDFKQQSDYAENTTFPAETLEDDLDKLKLEVQALRDTMLRGVGVPPDADLGTYTPIEIIRDTLNISISDNWSAASESTGDALVFYEATGNGTDYSGLIAPASISSSVLNYLPSSSGTILNTANIGSTVQAYSANLTSITYNFPSADGSANQVLKTDGSATLSWGGHDDLDGFVANEHIDWTSTTSAFSTSGAVATGNLTVTGNISATSSNSHVFNGTSSVNNTTVFYNSHATTPAGNLILFEGTPNNTTQYFLACSDSGVAGNVKAYIFSNGDLQNSNNSYGAISDIREKQDISEATSQIDDIKALKFKKYRLKSDVSKNIDKMHLGVIAQDLINDGMSGLITHNEDTDRYGVKYSVLTLKAVKALQEVISKIEALENRLNLLEGK